MILSLASGTGSLILRQYVPRSGSGFLPDCESGSEPVPGTENPILRLYMCQSLIVALCHPLSLAQSLASGKGNLILSLYLYKSLTLTVILVLALCARQSGSETDPVINCVSGSGFTSPA